MSIHSAALEKMSLKNGEEKGDTGISSETTSEETQSKALDAVDASQWPRKASGLQGVGKGWINNVSDEPKDNKQIE